MGKLTGIVGELDRSKIKLRETVAMMRGAMEAFKGSDGIPMTRVKVPSSGGKYFTVEGENDDMPPVNEIEGVILQEFYVKAYWDKPLGSGGTQAPTCASLDGISGWDADGMEHNCKTCRLNRMGSKDGGRGKACKDKVELIVLVEDEALPIKVSVPTMSIDNYKRYVASVLIPRGLKPWQVTTKMKLMKATNSNGIDYAQIMFTCTGLIDDEEMGALMGAIVPLLETAETAVVIDEGGVSNE